MKGGIWKFAVTLILITSVVGSILYFESLAKPTQPAPPNQNQLIVDNLSALPDGQVSFDVGLNEKKLEVIEAVIVNGKKYSWSEGSPEDPTILKNETKQWSINIGNLEENDSIQVIVEASAGSASINATVATPTPNGSTPADPIVDPETPNNQTPPDYIYDFYGGVNLFSEGIYILPTKQDPRTLFEEFEVANDYWKMLLETETNQATDQDFISILLSRGDKPTGGFNIQIENFAWFESYPAKFIFQVNFTDPGEDVIVTQVLTNPLVLMPIGKLAPGEYHIEVPIVQYILNFDEEGKPVYTQILKFAPIYWEQKLTDIKTDDPSHSTTFEVNLNGNEAPDLTVQVDLNNTLTEEDAKKIAESAYYQTLGEKLHRLDDITYDDEQISAHYIWGYAENDLEHTFDLTVDLNILKITIDHCR